MCQICVPFAKRRMEFATSHSPKNASNFLSKKIAQNVDKIDVWYHLGLDKRQKLKKGLHIYTALYLLDISVIVRY